jgi:hypothetical protein
MITRIVFEVGVYLSKEHDLFLGDRLDMTVGELADWVEASGPITLPHPGEDLVGTVRIDANGVLTIAFIKP